MSESMPTRIRSWALAIAAYVFSFANVGYVVKQLAGGFLDPLVAAGVSLVAILFCTVLALLYLLPRNRLEAAPKLSLPPDVIAEIEKSRLRRYRLEIVFVSVPTLICCLVFLLLLSFGKSQLLAAADVYVFDDGFRHGHQGKIAQTIDGGWVHFDRYQDIGSFTEQKLAEFVTSGYGITFRLRKRPSVTSCEILGIRLDILSVEEAPKQIRSETKVLFEPLVWTIQIPENAHAGMSIDAQLIQLDFADPTAPAALKKPNVTPALPNDRSQSCLVVIACEKECLIYYNLYVLTDAGWRSAPIEICSEEIVAFYKVGSDKLSGDAVFLDSEPALENTQPAPIPPSSRRATL